MQGARPSLYIDILSNREASGGRDDYLNYTHSRQAMPNKICNRDHIVTMSASCSILDIFSRGDLTFLRYVL